MTVGDEIAALERVRARLEVTLAAHMERHQGHLADNKVYAAWELLGQAIDGLRSLEGDIAETAKPSEPATSDDLTLIRGIDPDLARHLASLGVTRFADIAAWRAPEVHAMSQRLGLSREISGQNWIEQAALLGQRKSENLARDGEPPSTVGDSTPKATRLPGAAASSTVPSDANPRQLDEKERQLSRRLLHADAMLPAGTDEAAVTFVIKDPAQRSQPQQPTHASSSSDDQSLWRPVARRGEREVVSVAPAEEAEVVVIKPQAHVHYGSAAPSGEGIVRRFLKSLTGR